MKPQNTETECSFTTTDDLVDFTFVGNGGRREHGKEGTDQRQVRNGQAKKC